MYIGGGTLGTILVVLLDLWLLGNVRSPRCEQIIHKLRHLGRAAPSRTKGGRGHRSGRLPFDD